MRRCLRDLTDHTGTAALMYTASKNEKSCRYKIFHSQSFVPRDGPKLL